MAGSDSSAEIKALLAMVAVSLAMGGGVLLFKSDYRAVDIWKSNEAYYPNVRLPAGDPLRESLAAARDNGEGATSEAEDASEETGRKYKGNRNRGAAGASRADRRSSPPLSGEAAPAREPTLAETLAAAAAEFRRSIGQPRPDLEGAEGDALYAQEFDGDRVLTEESEVPSRVDPAEDQTDPGRMEGI